MNKEWTISQAMRARLTINRDGRLTSEQWKDLVTEPLVILLLVLAPLILILGPRLVALALRGWVMALAVVLLVVVVPIVARAWRYARLPVHFATLYAGDYPGAVGFFRRKLELYTADGEAVRFNKQLAPPTSLRPNRAYLVYYLRENDRPILLSFVPADHPDADQWKPSASFHTRFAERAGR